MHSLANVVFWVAVIGHFAGVAGILIGIITRFRQDTAMASAAVFHSTLVMLVTGFLLIWAESLHGEAFTDQQNAIIGFKALVLVVMMGLAFWLRRETPAEESAGAGDGVGVGAAGGDGAGTAAAATPVKSPGGPLWVYYTLAVLLTMNFTMGLIVAYVL